MVRRTLIETQNSLLLDPTDLMEDECLSMYEEEDVSAFCNFIYQ